MTDKPDFPPHLADPRIIETRKACGCFRIEINGYVTTEARCRKCDPFYDVPAQANTVH